MENLKVVINKYDIEGTIINIFSKTETVGDLSVGDYVFVNGIKDSS